MTDVNSEKRLVAALKRPNGRVTTDLDTDERVLARVSDGIYREPGAALRELLANAYDADAKEVIIQTDAPRFATISIRDDGHGMNEESLVRLIKHIGGSAKRSRLGGALGITSTSDPTRSPGGRKLIGKIGIGLFSVAQLTRNFRIITKTRGSRVRLIANVKLRRYSEADEEPKSNTKRFTGGTVTLQTAAADDADSHGTEIILLDIQPASRDLLRSKDIWDRVAGRGDTGSPYFEQTIAPPSYHVGNVTNEDASTIQNRAQLPWTDADLPEQRFVKLVQAVEEESTSRAKPSLSTTVDRYLQTIWNLSLALPLPYLEKHPFETRQDDDPLVFKLSNTAKGQAQQLEPKNKSIRELVALKHPPLAEDPTDFRVYIDNVRLFRPIHFNHLPTASRDNPSKRPLLFVGEYTPDLSKHPDEITGGRELSFEAYFLWTPKVVPNEHNGVLVRIANASGTLFDSTFFGYQVAEITRLAQISGEIFVTKGLDAALNIDRESFNFGHPHAKILTTWIHRALRQITNTQKRVAKDLRDARRALATGHAKSAISHVVEQELDAIGADDVPEVVWVDDAAEQRSARKQGKVGLDRSEVVEKLPPPKNSKTAKAERSLLEEKLRAVTQLLEAYGALRDLPPADQQKLIRAIGRVFVSDAT